MPATITRVRAVDVRFPTSDALDGSDAMNPDPDYSAACAILETSEPGLVGHGHTFTIGRGNELCVAAIEALAPRVVGRTLDEIEDAPGRFWRELVGDSQLRWLGPEKGVIHLATAALVNASWDLLARRAEKPVWKLLCDWSPEQIVAAIDFRHISDALSPQRARALLQDRAAGRAQREATLRSEGLPAYVTSAGWLGYDDEKIHRLCKQAIEDGWQHVKIKVGADLDDDLRRTRAVREAIGPERKLMVDANQVWDVDQAIAWTKALAPFDPWWIEEPTSPDDVLGHARIRRAVHPIGVATGEHCHNRVMFKQLFQAEAIDFCQIDACRMGGLNEGLAVMLMAAEFGVPVCPHAGGVGLCEYVQHFAAFDYVCAGASFENRVVEWADHLHEHFVTPARVDDGRYRVQEAPGFGVELRAESRERFRFPDGPVWRER